MPPINNLRSPFFSIITPTYNRVYTIERSVRSVLNQTFAAWEIIIVDDGSTDKTYDMLQPYLNQQVKYFYQENQGQSVARNKAIQESRGTFICFLDSDDYYLSNHLQVLYEAIAEQNFEIGVYKTGMFIQRGKGKLEKCAIYEKSSSQTPLHFYAQNFPGINSICYHSSMLNDHQFDPRFRLFQDTHLLLRLMALYPFYQLEAYTCVCVEHPGRVSHAVYLQEDIAYRIQNNIEAIDSLFQEFGAIILPHLSWQDRNYLICKKYVNHANGALLVRKFKLATELIFKAIKADRKVRHLNYYLKFFLKLPIKWLLDYPKAPTQKYAQN